MKEKYFVFCHQNLISLNPSAVILLNPEVELQLYRSVNVEMTSEKFCKQQDRTNITELQNLV